MPTPLPTRPLLPFVVGRAYRYLGQDLHEPSAVLPRYDNAICAKALQLDRLPKPRSSRLRRKAPYGAGTGARASVDSRSSSRPKEAAQVSELDRVTSRSHAYGCADLPRKSRSELALFLFVIEGSAVFGSTVGS